MYYIVDYKLAYKASGRKIKETTGEKILWVTEKAIEWATQNDHMTRGAKGSIIGWSMAGEGLILLANDFAKCKQLNIKSIALYYPSNHQKIELQSQIPILIQTGELDNVTEANDIKAYYSKHDHTEIVIYANAHHGFDIQSLSSEKSMRFPPLFGNKYIFKFNQQTQKEAMERLIRFLMNSII